MVDPENPDFDIIRLTLTGETLDLIKSVNSGNSSIIVEM